MSDRRQERRTRPRDSSAEDSAEDSQRVGFDPTQAGPQEDRPLTPIGRAPYQRSPVDPWASDPFRRRDPFASADPTSSALGGQQTEPSVRPKVRKAIPFDSSQMSYPSAPRSHVVETDPWQQFRSGPSQSASQQGRPPQMSGNRPGPTAQTSQRISILQRPSQASSASASTSAAGGRFNVRSVSDRGVNTGRQQSYIPDSDITRRYRDPVTGEPSFERLLRTPVRRDPEWERETPPSDSSTSVDTSRSQLRGRIGGPDVVTPAVGSYLSNVSKDHISKDVFGPSRSRTQTNVLEGIPKVKKIEGTYDNKGRNQVRYVPERTVSQPIRKRLEPSTSRQLTADRDPNFNRSMATIGSRPMDPLDAAIGPIGPMGFGPQPSNLPQISATGAPVPTSNKPQRRMDVYRERFMNLDPEEAKIYKSFRDQVNLRANPEARSRMVPRPSTMRLSDQDRRALAENKAHQQHLMRHKIGSQNVTFPSMNADRRRFVKDRAQLPLALGTPAPPKVMSARETAEYEKNRSRMKQLVKDMSKMLVQTISEIDDEDDDETDNDNEE